MLTLVFGIWLALDDYSITRRVDPGRAGAVGHRRRHREPRRASSTTAGAGARARQPLAVMTLATLAVLLFLMIFKPGA